jgi:hypothetical protein
VLLLATIQYVTSVFLIILYTPIFLLEIRVIIKILSQLSFFESAIVIFFLPKNEKLVLNTQIHTYQILKNEVEIINEVF